MANRKVSIFVRRYVDGKQITQKAEWSGNATLKPVVGGIFWLRWDEGKRSRYERVGPDPKKAVEAQGAGESIIAGERGAAVPVTATRRTIRGTIETFLLEQTHPRKKGF